MKFLERWGDFGGCLEPDPDPEIKKYRQRFVLSEPLYFYYAVPTQYITLTVLFFAEGQTTSLLSTITGMSATSRQLIFNTSPRMPGSGCYQNRFRSV